MAPMLDDWDASSSEHILPKLNHSPSLKSILYVDAYDSFSYNVVAMLEETLGAKVTVITIDSDWPDSNMIDFLQHYEAIVLGPGPGDPNIPSDVGIMRDIWNLHDSDLMPVFGICLGFQSLCLHHGVPIERLPYPLHGQIHKISTSSKDIFEDLPEVEVTLYHSLYANSASSTSPELEYLAWLSLTDRPETPIPMAVRHLQKPFWGVQFHPESCKSDFNACKALLQNWWKMALAFNKIVGRGGYCSLPETVISPHTSPTPFPDAAYEMLKWSKSASRCSIARTFQRSDLTAETISEFFNKPGTPTVVFQSNGQYSIVSVPSPGSWRLEYTVDTHVLHLLQLYGEHRDVESRLTVAQLWDALRYLMEMKKVNSGSLQVPFWGGFLGYFSYELGLTCLPHPGSAQASETPKPSGTENASSRSSFADPPDVSLLWCERSVVVDNATGDVVIQSIRQDDTTWLDETLQQLQGLSTSDSNSLGEHGLDSILREAKIQLPEEKKYKQQIESCQAELKAGESYELCLTSETSITLPVSEVESDRVVFPWKLYKRLKKYNPAAFSAFADLGDTKIASSSPECFLNWDRHSTLEMKPMKGTVRKSPDMTMEKACEILSSTKEMAENLMIADLIRHDLYGICGSGGVHVEKLLEVADYGRVYSMITHIKGKVRPNHPGFAVRHMPQLHTPNMSVHGLTTLQRCLPPGSMTGAPKERSCMHLKTIENRTRGIYSGVMGFLDLGGGGSFSVLIRSAFTCYGGHDYTENKQQTWRIGAGGAITTLSTAEGEWDEMLTKLRVVCNVFKPLDADEKAIAAS
ncbi:Glutamine amidotransferase type 1 [Penicillium paradoxum]|uniref:Glutamine amidotransferase type 1 n=1 Tax=Penicillium paradoxum TaxID=176176 RepID=UPI0025482192|nr:Glutamine amidotransferase type 1 [Penicillium paradoxum]KAJ5778984.1 Glutamine amidotransferase type 1 [Penicillium paradoxum]